MLQRGNKKLNNQMTIRQPQYQENEDFEGIETTPKPKFYQNIYNNPKSNNTANSLKRQNNRMNINLNSNINPNMKMKINMNNNLNNNMNNNINNNNINRNISNNKINKNIVTNNNSNINKALLILRNEFKKKDDKIKLLELKVEELEKKINMVTNFKFNSAQQNKSKILNENNNISVPLTKNFTFAENNSGEINQINKIDVGVESNFTQTKSSNQFKINNNQYNLNSNKNNNNISEGIKEKENLSLTINSGNSKTHSKNEVKSYLKEVKEKMEPYIFREFIKNIKLLTSSKDKNGIDRNKIVENVKFLFGDKYKELFIKFESIIGVDN